MATATKTAKVAPLESVEPTPAPTPESPQPTYEPPEKYRGKSIEDVIKMHSEAEKRLGGLGDELGKERKEREKTQNDLNYVATLYQSQQSQQVNQQEPKPSNEVEFDYDNPHESMEKIVDKRFKHFTENQKKEQQQQRYYEATQSYARGRSSSLKNSPELYAGIERKVETAVWNAYLAGMIPQWDLGETKTWENAARLIHMNNEDWERIVPPKTRPVSPTTTDTPGGMRSPSVGLPGEALEFDTHGEEMLALAEKGGAKRDEFIKEVKARRKQFGASRQGG